MSINILAILLSFAMMLTGAGVDGQSAEVSRTLVVHDISVTYNDESVDLPYSLVAGVDTDGKKAVFDLGLVTEDETLFPIQLGVDEAGLTLLVENADTAVRVTADAFEGFSEQLGANIEAMTAQMQGQMGGDSELTAVVMNDLIPAYAGMIEAVKDQSFVEQVQKDAEKVFDELIDRGEGTPVNEMIEGESYALTAYSYSIDSAQMAELADKVYSLNDTLSAFYNAIFKLYSVMPEESGLNGLTSFADLFEKFSLNMRMDMEEKRSEDGDVALTDAVMTMDMKDMMASMAAAQGADAAQEIPEIPPIVINIHSTKVEDSTTAEVTCDYEANGAGMSLEARSSVDGKDQSVDMELELLQGGETMGSMRANAFSRTHEASGKNLYSMNYVMDVNETYLEFATHGEAESDGTSHNSFSFSAENDQLDLSVSFNADVTEDLIEDKVTGHKAYEITDLSEEAIQKMMEDQSFLASVMQISASLSSDGQKLTNDESIANLLAAQAVADAYTGDYAEDYDDDYDDDDYEYEEPEDDGVLGFGMPEFTWIPEGWRVTESNVDTAYDMVDIMLSDGSYDNYIYASFYENMNDVPPKSYTVGEDGSLVPVEGREISVTDYGQDGIYVNLSEAGANISLSVYSKTLDMEAVGKLVAGLQFTEAE